jgi:hypothetical protein
MLIEGIKLFQTFNCFELQICGLKAVYWQGVGCTVCQLYCTVSVPGTPDIIGVFHFLAFLSNAYMVPVQYRYEDLYRHSFDKRRTRKKKILK